MNKFKPELSAIFSRICRLFANPAVETLSFSRTVPQTQPMSPSPLPGGPGPRGPVYKAEGAAAVTSVPPGLSQAPPVGKEEPFSGNALWGKFPRAGIKASRVVVPDPEGRGLALGTPGSGAALPCGFGSYWSLRPFFWASPS